MYILVSNDDGVHSPGLLALRQALSALGETAVVAPDRNMSATGLSRKLYDPLRARPVTLADGSEALSCDGTPGDCVALAVLGLLPRRPDLVVSGINLGPNLGSDVAYSGTVAAAMEGAMVGVPAIAVSLCTRSEWDFRVAAEAALRLAKAAVSHHLPPGVILNVNVPPGPPRSDVQVQVTRLGRRVYRDVLEVRHDPRGNPYYWISGDEPESHLEEGTDVHAVAHGYVSVTPLHLDLTNHALLEEVRGWAM
jgi:5'-nucleotidase